MYTNIEILSEAFLEWLKVKAFTPATRKSYRIYLNKFLKFLEAENIESLETITPRVAYNYQTHLYYLKTKNEKPLSVFTQHNAIMVMKAFFAFLVETEKIEMDPSSGLQLPKKPKSLPSVMTEQEVMSVIEIPDTTQKIGLRNRMILELLYATGMRVSELTGLDLYDVSFESEEIRIRLGKGGKERIVPMGEMAREYVYEYVKTIRPQLVKNPAEQALIVSKSGRRMNKTDLLMMIRGCAKKAHLEKRITPHTFRHTCATHMLRGGADIRYIQMMLGHQSITSTQIYTHVDITDLKEVHRKFHPREKND